MSLLQPAPCACLLEMSCRTSTQKMVPVARSLRIAVYNGLYWFGDLLIHGFLAKAFCDNTRGLLTLMSGFHLRSGMNLRRPDRTSNCPSYCVTRGRIVTAQAGGFRV